MNSLKALALELAACQDPSSRQEQLLRNLSQRSIPCLVQTSPDGKVVNIMAESRSALALDNPDGPAILISAHYDVIENSCGANDNLAAASILVHLLEQSPVPVAGLFLDGEETGHTGAKLFVQEYLASQKRKQQNKGGWSSKDYLQESASKPAPMFQLSNLEAIIVLDLCGYGTTEAFRIRNRSWHTKVRTFTSRALKKKYQLAKVSNLPASDDLVLSKLNVPVMLISMLPSSDVKMLQAAGHAYGMLFESSGEYAQMIGALEVMETIHGGIYDRPQILDEGSMEHVFNHLQESLDKCL